MKKAPGQVPDLTLEALAGLKERLEKGAAFKSYGEIVEWLKKEYNLELTYATVYAWVHYRLQAKLKVPRPQSALQDVKAVGLFKKTSSQQSRRFKIFLGLGKRLRYLCQDETRLGLKTLTGKVITARGVKPVAPILWKRENFWLYGVVEPMRLLAFLPIICPC